MGIHTLTKVIRSKIQQKIRDTEGYLTSQRMKFLVLLFCAACSLASAFGDDIRDFQNGNANEMVWKPNSNSRTFDDVNGIETLAIPSEGGVAESIELKRMANFEDRKGLTNKRTQRCRKYKCSRSCSGVVVRATHVKMYVRQN